MLAAAGAALRRMPDKWLSGYEPRLPPWHQARTTADGGGKVSQTGCHSPDQHIFALECVGEVPAPAHRCR